MLFRSGFGDAQGKTGGNATKEIIGDALRNAAMRFGIGTYLWGKSDKAKAELTRMGVDDDAPATPSGDAIGSDAPIVRAIYGKKKALGMTDNALTAALKRDFGKEHPGDLTLTEAKALADKMQAAIDKSEAEDAEDLSEEQPWPNEA